MGCCQPAGFRHLLCDPDGNAKFTVIAKGWVQYWIAVSPGAADTVASWQTNNLGIFGMVAQKSGDASFYSIRAKLPAFDVQNISYSAPRPAPAISAVSNAGGESPTIAPNSWLEIKGVNLAPPGEARIWQDADFVNHQLPTSLDSVSVTMNGKNAYVYYVSFSQINVLTPPDLIQGPVQVIVTRQGVDSAIFTAQAQRVSPSFFLFSGSPYVTALHADSSRIGPPSLYPGPFTPAKPGEVVELFGNGFGATSPPVLDGSASQMGILPTLPQVKIGDVPATVQFAGLVSPGLYQFNVIVPLSALAGDNDILATYNGATTQPGALLTIIH